MTNDEVFEIRRKHRANIPDKHHEAYRKNWDMAIQRKSMRAAVKAKCLDCMCWVKMEVQVCTCVACPLYEYRPFVKHATGRPPRKPKKAPDGSTNEPTARVA